MFQVLRWVLGRSILIQSKSHQHSAGSVRILPEVAGHRFMPVHMGLHCTSALQSTHPQSHAGCRREPQLQQILGSFLSVRTTEFMVFGHQQERWDFSFWPLGSPLKLSDHTHATLPIHESKPGTAYRMTKGFPCQLKQSLK